MWATARYEPTRSTRASSRRLARCCGVRLEVAALEDRSVPSTASDLLDSIPLSFEANIGQADGRVQYLSRGLGYQLFLTGSEAILRLDRAAGAPEVGPQQFTNSVLRMQLVGANAAISAVGQNPLPGTVNYFLGDEPSQWRTDVPTYGQVALHSVYPGIDLIYYGNQRQLEYDFVVAPGADPSDIRLGFQGADWLNLDGQGNLILHTAAGDVVQHAPILYQQTARGRVNVEGSFETDGNQVSFRVGAYDGSLPLVIDPVLSYSTFLGGSGYDAGTAIAVDAAGSVYVTGQTGTASFPTTAGAYRTALGDTNNAAFVTKLDPAGNGLVYSTYLGGGTFSHTVGYGIAVDVAGNAYVTGETLSANYPTTPGSFQSPSIGGYDAFVTKLNPQGNGLVYSVRLGGDFDDFGRAIAVDNAGRAAVTGWVRNSAPDGPHFPIANAFQPNYGGGNFDAFVTELNVSGSALVFSTYLGGGTILNTTDDYGQGIAFDPDGNVYVTGHTYSQDFPTTPGALMRNGGGSLDAFVTKFAPSGSAVYSTFLGSNRGHEEAYGIAVDADGSAYVTGNTDAWNDAATTTDEGFPTTPGAFQRNLAGQIDAFVAKLNPAGSALVYGTYLGGFANGGGDGVDRGWGIAVDPAGTAYITGDTNSTNFPVDNAVQAMKRFDKDAFVTALSPSGSALVYSTFLGGEFTDQARGVALDQVGSAYVTGSTDSFQFPTTSGAFRVANAGGLEHHTDAFVAKITVPAAPRVQSVVVNNGSSARSVVTSLTVTLSSQVTLAGTVANAFRLTRNGGGAVNFTAIANVVGSVTVVTINNFNGSETEFGSLRDGRFTLTAVASQISAGGQQMASNFTFSDDQGLFRFYGDMNGDQRVDISDFGALSVAYNRAAPDPLFNPALDFNYDGHIDIADFGQFSVRFFTTLP